METLQIGLMEFMLQSLKKMIEIYLNEEIGELQALSFKGKQVRVRGFWHAKSKNEGVLAATPHLKTCCIGSPHTIHQQIVVRDFYPTGSDRKALTLEGTFNISEAYDVLGNSMHYYVLENPKEIVFSQQGSNESIFFFIFILFFIVWKVLQQRQKRYQKAAMPKG